MHIKKTLLALFLSLLAGSAMAQFTGPSASAAPSSVQQALEARFGSYVTVVGHIVAFQREEYYTVGDTTGETGVEIEAALAPACNTP